MKLNKSSKLNKQYILFLDAETSGVPPNLNLPTEQMDQWPALVQLAWSICDWEGNCIKRENFFIYEQTTIIQPEVQKIHGLSQESLKFNGLRRKVVLLKILKDIRDYQPLVVGHFVQFDIKMLEVGCFRSRIKFNSRKLKTFCTMTQTTDYQRLINQKQPKLGTLYLSLFGKKMQLDHDAAADAEATQLCFFKLLHLGKISKENILSPKQENTKSPKDSAKNGCGILLLFFIIIITFYGQL